MVRIKERYLLFNILYPDASPDLSKPSLPDILVYNQPTTDACTGRSISHAVKAEITNLFGDYGAGAVERTLRGLYYFLLSISLQLPLMKQRRDLLRLLRSSICARLLFQFSYFYPSILLPSQPPTLQRCCSQSSTVLAVKYLSNATSTCILQCSREHYRLVWAALTMIDRVPTKGGPGKPCVVRVVRVSGTIKKVEQEAVRRARLLILAAKDEMAGKGSDALSSLFGGKTSMQGAAMVNVEDESGSEADFGDED